MVAGGSEGAITELGVAGFTGLNALNTTDDPKRATTESSIYSRDIGL